MPLHSDPAIHSNAKQAARATKLAVPFHLPSVRHQWGITPPRRVPLDLLPTAYIAAEIQTARRVSQGLISAEKWSWRRGAFGANLCAEQNSFTPLKFLFCNFIDVPFPGTPRLARAASAGPCTRKFGHFKYPYPRVPPVTGHGKGQRYPRQLAGTKRQRRLAVRAV
ncbi:hypothetical protein PSHT_09378 [Puccinia striiformis]|uniref:Uncharacterized protein n=1 Tax=Puccinia striiformis TaxID=27350 RepID=A0A2S4VH24_9BASI|nr:hypothetical protein PSHT_09378 [Puccinia striiformis]